MNETGWPEGYGWEDYLEGQMEFVKTNRAEEILCDEIAKLESKDEQRKAIKAWEKLRVNHTLKTSRLLLELKANLNSLLLCRQGSDKSIGG